MRCSVLVRAGTGLLIVLLVIAPAAQAAGKPSRPSGTTLSCTVDVISMVVDEQDTTAYYDDGSDYCTGTDASDSWPAGFTGDSVYYPALYNFTNWSPISTLAASQYVNGDTRNMIQNPLRATIASNYTTLNLDLNGTSRTITVDLNNHCGFVYGEPQCPTPWGTASGTAVAPGLLNVFLTTSESGATFMSMGICTSRTCPDAAPAYGKFWYTFGGENWRVDWETLRVLRMSDKTWYIVANECDGTDVAGLVKMNGKNTKGVLTGYYMIPLFIRVVAQ